MRITILGSCRQSSLLTLYPCTTIRDDLTYPHYTKEAIQAIEFCKGTLMIAPELTRYVFRSGILDKKELDPAAFREQFDSTDLFVIEIASRISYEYGGAHVHHILAEPEWGFQHRADIVQRDLTDGEIEQDLLVMRNLLQPKKMMIVSHIYTRQTGKRYDLVSLLRTLCTKHGIPFFDPVAELGVCDPTLVYLHEPLLAHYSTYGHKVIGQKYKEFIDRL